MLESNSIKEEKSLEKYKHIVTRSVSGKPSESQIDYQTGKVSKDDLFIICSDGVHNIISIEQLIEYNKQIDGLQELEKTFLREAQDNYSIIFVTL